MRQLLLGALALAVACDRPAPPGTSAGSAAGSAAGGSAAQAAPQPAGSGSTVDPWATRPKPPETPAAREKRAEAALARVATIEPVVAKLRALSFGRAVPTKYQTTGEFQAFLHREIAKDLPGQRSRDLSAALAHLGFL